MSKTGGWTVTVKEHGLSIDVFLELYMSICDSTTNKKVNLTQLGNAIERQLKNTYEISYFKDCYESLRVKSGLDNFPDRRHPRTVKKSVRVHIKVHQRIIYNINQKLDNEHLVDIKDDSKLIGLYGKANKIGGNELYLRETYVKNMVIGRDNNTIPHEFGHTLGLFHVDDNWVFLRSMREQWNIKKMIANKTNIMFHGGGQLNDKTSTTIIPEQIDIIIENFKFGRINKP